MLLKSDLDVLQTHLYLDMVVNELNKQSGLFGLTGLSDFRDVVEAMTSKEDKRGLNQTRNIAKLRTHP